jgi:DNA invertase Pin-like site-specific DNA recombinase
VAEPGPSFKWGAVLRASKPRRVVLPDGTVQFVVESTDRQDLELLEHIRNNKMGVVVESYADVASAWMPGAKRPRYRSALHDLEAGKIHGIACVAVDRLTRRRDRVRPILNAMEAMGGRLFFLWDGLDTASDDPDTELKLHTLVARAEQEAERTSRRYKQVAQHRARQRKISGGGTRPFGHDKTWAKLVGSEADAIRDAAKRVLDGKGVYSIVQDWNAHGPKPVKAKQWTTQVLTGILLEHRLVAKRDYYGDVFDLDGVPPILDLQTWERVCAKLGAPKEAKAPRVYRLLSGLATCGRCTVALRGGRNSRANKPIYVCPPKGRGQGSCGSLCVNSDPVDEIVSERVVKWLSDKRNVNNLLGLYVNNTEAEASRLRIGELNEYLVELSILHKKRKIRLAEYEARWDETVAERAEHQQRVAINREAALLLETLSFDDVASEWASRSQEWKRNILNLCTKCIVVEPVGKTAGASAQGFTFTNDRVRVVFLV